MPDITAYQDKDLFIKSYNLGHYTLNAFIFQGIGADWGINFLILQLTHILDK